MTQVVSTTMHGSVREIRFVNEKSRNSMTAQMREQFESVLDLAIADTNTRVIYLTGSGRAFCAGGDLPTLKSTHDPWSTHRRFLAASSWLRKLVRMNKPLVVGVNGFAVGGGLGIALTGDIIIAADSARFRSGWFSLGVMPDIGAMYLLPRLVGMAQAKNLIYSNSEWTARQAFERGLVKAVVADEALDREGLAQAQALAEGPVEAMGLTRWIMGRSFETGFEEMAAFENLGQSLNFASEAFHEGIDAVTSSRTPDFTGASDREVWRRQLEQTAAGEKDES